MKFLQGEAIININEYSYKSKNLCNTTPKALERIEKFIEKLNNQGVTFQTVTHETSVTFHWKYLYKSKGRGPGGRIDNYEKLLKKQGIRFIKTMDDVKATFTWDNTTVSFI